MQYLRNCEGSKINNRFYQNINYFNDKAEIQKTFISRIYSFALLITVYFLISLICTVLPESLCAAEKSRIPSYGRGPIELIIFSDYFCESCQSIEKDLETVQDRLLAMGEVKITFVDMPAPGNLSSPLFIKYFLYAVQADSSYVNATQARKLIFKMARQNSITENAIEKTFMTQGIAFKTFNYKPILLESKNLINKYKANKAPTYILKYSQNDIRKYTDPEQIRKELLPALQALTQKTKSSPNITHNNKKKK